MIIKGPEDANLSENFEGNMKEQSDAQNKIQDIETNKMYTWADMSKVKKELWNKLHAAKELMKKKAINLAQMISRNTNHLMNNYVPDNLKTSLSQLY
jgi:microcystin degradation protein MlrC